MPAALAPKAAKPGEHRPALGTAQGAGAGSRLRTHGEHPKEDGTGGKALPKAPARSLIHPIAELGMQLWKDSGTALEKWGISPQVKHQVHQGCQSLPEDQAETGENVRARGCSEQSLKVGIWGKEIPIIPPLLLRMSSFPPVQPWAAHGGTWEGATGKDGHGSVPHQNPQPRSSGAHPSSSQPGSGAPETAREVPGAPWASAAHRLQQALSKETQSGAGPGPRRRGAERHSPAGPALLCFALLKNRTI